MAKKDSGGTSQNLPLDELIKQALDELYRRRVELSEAIENLEAQGEEDHRIVPPETILEAGTV